MTTTPENQPLPEPKPASDEAEKLIQEKLDAEAESRVWEEPIGLSEPEPFNPDDFEPGMTPEEIKAMLEEQE